MASFQIRPLIAPNYTVIYAAVKTDGLFTNMDSILSSSCTYNKVVFTTYRSVGTIQTG